MQSNRWWVPALAVGILAACGGSSNSGGSGGTGGLPNGFYIQISGMAYSPLELSVPPGGTVTVINKDAMQHSVTSEAAAGSFTPGDVSGVSFDTGIFSTGTMTFTIPATATNGTVIPYYCRPHLGAMVTPNGTIKVDDSAVPGPAPGGTGGTGGGGGGGGGY